jgi:hypothetical protein
MILRSSAATGQFRWRGLRLSRPRLSGFKTLTTHRVPVHGRGSKSRSTSPPWPRRAGTEAAARRPQVGGVGASCVPGIGQTLTLTKDCTKKRIMEVSWAWLVMGSLTNSARP